MGGSADIHMNKRDGTSQYGETSDTERAEYADFIFVKNIMQPQFLRQKIMTKMRHLLVCDKCANGLKWDKTNKKHFFHT